MAIHRYSKVDKPKNPYDFWGIFYGQKEACDFCHVKPPEGERLYDLRTKGVDDWGREDMLYLAADEKCAAKALGITPKQFRWKLKRRQESLKAQNKVRRRRAFESLGLPERVGERFTALGSAQRSAPEDAMRDVQEALGGGVLSDAVENVGDLTHRMTESLGWGHTGLGLVRPKVKNKLRSLRNPYGFEREHNEQVESNAANAARTKGTSTDVYRKRVDDALAKYAEEHNKLPVYNEAQWLAREAAIRLGKKDFKGAEKALAKLADWVEDEDLWRQHALAHQVGPDGEPLEWKP